MGWSPIRRLQLCREIQHRSTNPASDLDSAQLGDVDPVLLLRKGIVLDCINQTTSVLIVFKNWSISRSLALIVPVICFMGAVQAALIITLGRAKERDLEWPLILMAALAAALLAAGVGSHYVDIYRHRTVRGISFIFVGLDALGDLTSLLSVFFQPKLDILGIIIYATELALWCGIFACGAYYNLIPWLKEKYSNSGEATASEGSQPSESATAAHTSGIALYGIPSSTSVFRTTSAEIDLNRQRSVSSRVSSVHLPPRVA